jgi:hypothetical protein
MHEVYHRRTGSARFKKLYDGPGDRVQGKPGDILSDELSKHIRRIYTQTTALTPAASGNDPIARLDLTSIGNQSVWNHHSNQCLVDRRKRYRQLTRLHSADLLTSDRSSQ